MPSTCCSQSNTDTGRLFNWMSGLNRLRHRWFGFEHNQRQLLDGIRAQGIADARLLEIGCGPGYLHQTLLLEGAAQAIGVDLSAGMLAIARREAESAGLASRTNYLHGDFVQLAEQLPVADICILDKVVCCYPDWQSLLDAVISRCGSVCALTYPRDRRMVHLGVRVMGRLLSCLHCCYQPYLHDPKKIRAHLRANGFHLAIEQLTGGWHTEVFVRNPPEP